MRVGFVFAVLLVDCVVESVGFIGDYVEALEVDLEFLLLHSGKGNGINYLLKPIIILLRERGEI